MKWLFEESNRLYPVDENKLFNGVPFLAATTNVDTGQADYYRVTRDNFHHAIEATTALPIATSIPLVFLVVVIPMVGSLILSQCVKLIVEGLAT